jgi:3-dehydroshikimate dehydratase
MNDIRSRGNGSIVPGLVSITFRQLAPDAVIRAAAEAGLRAIEWGGDVHVPHGNFAVARAVGRATRAAGLAVACYGSYYRAAVSEAGAGPRFDAVLDTAVALEAPCVRVWAGNRAAADADADWRARVVEDLRHVCERAAAADVIVALEYHDGTLTDTDESALALLVAVDRPNLKTLWQPPHGKTREQCVASLAGVLPYLQHLHVFHWCPESRARLPLQAGSSRWEAYLALAATGGKDSLYALLEFVRADDPENLAGDARVLCDWIARIQAR